MSLRVIDVEQRSEDWHAARRGIVTASIVGALITGNKAALSDPTWPKFVGSWLPQKETWVGGLRYEDTHRVIAATTGLLTLALAVWLQVREPRRWLRRPKPPHKSVRNNTRPKRASGSSPSASKPLPTWNAPLARPSPP